jgi:hypothetical protein
MKKSIEITQKENEVLKSLVDGLYAEPSYSDVGLPEFRKDTGLSNKILRGVLSSLIQKQVITVWDRMDEISYVNGRMRKLGLDPDTHIYYLSPQFYHLLNDDIRTEWMDADPAEQIEVKVNYNQTFNIKSKKMKKGEEVTLNGKVIVISSIKDGIVNGKVKETGKRYRGKLADTPPQFQKGSNEKAQDAVIGEIAKNAIKDTEKNAKAKIKHGIIGDGATEAEAAQIRKNMKAIQSEDTYWPIHNHVPKQEVKKPVKKIVKNKAGLRPLSPTVEKAVKMLIKDLDQKNEKIIEKSGVSSANLSGLRRSVKLIAVEGKSPEDAVKEYSWLSVTMGKNIEILAGK